MRKAGSVAVKRKAKQVSVSHAATSKFARRGLRNYFEYRDLGVKRARPGRAPEGDWHYHDCSLQFVYVVKGWVKMEYEGTGEVLMKAGSCFHQPPRIRHRELAHSKDLEMVEVVSPANFKTYSA